MIKILQFQLSNNIGGIESFLYNVYRCIDKNKIHFDFVTDSNNPALGEDLKQLGAKIYYVSSLTNYFKCKKSIFEIMKNKYDIIHFNKNSAANIIPIKIIKSYFPDVKIIIHSHNTSPTKGKFSYLLHKINQNKIISLGDEFFACSDIAGKWMYSNKYSYKIIKNGIDIKKYLFSNEIRENKRKGLCISENNLVICNIGRFSLQKNQIYLINLFKEIRKLRKNCKLILIGKGELEDKLKNIVKNENLLNEILFLKDRYDINEILIASDIFIMSSLYEGLPISAVEAQASGLPIFLSNNISMETEITNAVKWYSLGDNMQDVAKSILTSNITSKETRINRNKQVAKNGFDILNTVKKLEEIYNTLV